MKYAFILIVLLGFSSVVVGQTEREYNGVHAIAELQEGWLIIRLPAFQKKLHTIDSLLQIGALSVTSQENLLREKAQTLANRHFIATWYPLIFSGIYTFSNHAFIYTHDTNAFLDGDLQAWDKDGKPVQIDRHEKIFFATLDGETGAAFRFTSKEHQPLSYPFPNNILARGSELTLKEEIPSVLKDEELSEIIDLSTISELSSWVASFTDDESSLKRAYRHVRKVDKKLHAFYRRKYR